MRIVPAVSLEKIITAGAFIGLLIVLGLSFYSNHTSNRYPAHRVSSVAQKPKQIPRPRPFQFPGGGRVLLPNYRLVALYGTPDTTALGTLGDQPLEPAIARIKDLAAQYQPFSAEPIYPAFEIITTVASAGPGDDGDYSYGISAEKLRAWVEAAKASGIYVVLDLQPGRTDFLTQAKTYEEFLSQPHVGLALDPEWRLGPTQTHLKQIGTVSAAEINQTAAWLADITKMHKLPQKMLLLHQFKLTMIADRQTLDTTRPELTWLIQMDGLGNQNVKQDTWRNIREGAPANVLFGWKNFIDEDKPMLSPEQTMQIVPKPFYVSYQ